MIKQAKRCFMLILMAVCLLCNFSGCVGASAGQKATEEDSTARQAAQPELQSIPKYVFFFIGDGMSYPQIQAAAYAQGKTAMLPFMKFPSIGVMTTYSSESEITDSAAAATAMATGHKTSSGRLCMNESAEKSYSTIAEYYKKILGYKIGILTTVSLNHATPAGFYAHQESRKNFYQIGLDLIKSDFDFFAGGGFTDSRGSDGDRKNLYTLAREAGYQIVRDREEAQALTADKGKTILLSEKKVDEDYMKYHMDLEEGEWALKDFVSKGIEMLDNDTGFFMMVEGGKIDLANHANDGATMLGEMQAFSDAIDTAVQFYEAHPQDTLIIVTGDHESGGLTIGNIDTGYNSYIDTLSSQSLSFSRFNADYIPRYKADQTAFEEVITEVEDLYGTEFNKEEVELLQQAYIRTLEVGKSIRKNMTWEEYVKYGSYEPFTVTLSHVMNQRAGLTYATYFHTGIPVPVYAIGRGSELFNGSYDNTDIFNKLYELMEFEKAKSQK